jgi:hypothetical protein
MKTRVPLFVLVAAVVALAGLAPRPAAAAPQVTSLRHPASKHLPLRRGKGPDLPEPVVTITVQGLPEDGLLELDVGESVTFRVDITSDSDDVPFILAGAMTDAYYPGRGVVWHGGDRTTHATTATLYLTMTGKGSTAGLPAVSGWPRPEDEWDEGTAPVAIVAGARFKRGVMVTETFAFAVQVPRAP